MYFISRTCHTLFRDLINFNLSVKPHLHVRSTSPFLWATPFIFLTLHVNTDMDCIKPIFKRYKKTDDIDDTCKRGLRND